MVEDKKKKGKTFVKPYERKNKKSSGTHKVSGHTRKTGGSAKDVAEAYEKETMAHKRAQQARLEAPVKRRIEESGGDTGDWDFDLGVAECPHGHFVYDYGEGKMLAECEHGCHKMVEREEKNSDVSLGDLF